VNLIGACALPLLWSAGLSEPAAPQEHVLAVAPGTVSGTVLDAASGEPLAGALVVLQPTPDGALRTGERGTLWSSQISVATDDTGSYSFAEVSPGEYRLYVRRLGYRPVSLLLDLQRARGLRVSVGMILRPIRLDPAVGTAARPVSFNIAEPSGASVTDRRRAAELLRQERFLESDVRALTREDLVEAVTLAEHDVFRALHRLPGVTTRDDFTAELWTRGAPWSHTRVFYDGMPLFNPVHTAGVFSGINPDALGTAFFHPGARSASIGEGAAGVLNLTSRQWGRRTFGGEAGLSVASARLALGGPIPNGGSWLMAARRTYVDLLSGLVAPSADRIPYAYLDLAGRVGMPVSDDFGIAASIFVERDQVWGTVPRLLKENEGRWGNSAGQITASARLGRFHTDHTVGFSSFSAAIATVQFVADSNLQEAVPTHAPTTNEIGYLTLRSRVEPIAGTSADSWAVGYDLEFQRQEFVGPYPRPYPSVLLARTLGQWAEQLRLSLWGERRFTVRSLELQLGVRTEFGGGVANAGPVVLAPRVTARLPVAPTVVLAAGYGRSYQYTQSVAPAGPGIGPDLHITEVWLMANDTIPAIRSDVATVGVESWLDKAWLGAATIYGRFSSGVTVPDPSPGTLAPERPVYWSGSIRAAGIEFSVRRLEGPVTTSLAYSYGVSRMTAGGITFPSTSARRHVLDATVMARTGSTMRVGGALTASSGARFTRVHLDPVGCAAGGATCPDTLFTTTMIENPGAAEAPAYVLLDLVFDWVHRFRSWELGVTVQLKNALNRRNAVTYVGSYSTCTPASAAVRWVRPGVCDRFARGLPLLPLIGVSARF